MSPDWPPAFFPPTESTMAIADMSQTQKRTSVRPAWRPWGTLLVWTPHREAYRRSFPHRTRAAGSPPGGRDVGRGSLVFRPFASRQNAAEWLCSAPVALAGLMGVSRYRRALKSKICRVRTPSGVRIESLPVYGPRHVLDPASMRGWKPPVNRRTGSPFHRHARHLRPRGSVFPRMDPVRRSFRSRPARTRWVESGHCRVPRLGSRERSRPKSEFQAVFPFS